MNDFMDMRIHFGIRKPETAEEVERHATLDGMRKAIWEAYRDSPVIRMGLETARYNGLNGEDTYTLLAYHALRQLEDHARRHSDLLRLMPVPPIIVPREND